MRSRPAIRQCLTRQPQVVCQHHRKPAAQRWVHNTERHDRDAQVFRVDLELESAVLMPRRRRSVSAPMSDRRRSHTAGSRIHLRAGSRRHPRRDHAARLQGDPADRRLQGLWPPRHRGCDGEGALVAIRAQGPALPRGRPPWRGADTGACSGRRSPQGVRAKAPRWTTPCHEAAPTGNDADALFWHAPETIRSGWERTSGCDEAAAICSGRSRARGAAEPDPDPPPRGLAQRRRASDPDRRVSLRRWISARFAKRGRPWRAAPPGSRP